MRKFLFDFILFPLFQVIDFFYPKKTSYWGFSVHHIKSDQFIENARAVFEEVKSDKSIKKIIFTRDNTIDFGIEDAENAIIVKLMTLRGLMLMLKCKVVFVTHSISMDFSYRFGSSQFSVLKLNMNKRVVVNLWHGIPLKKLYALWNPDVRKRLDRVKYRHFERKHYAGLITSSQIDSYAMATMFYPIKYENIWVTGLPRNDFLIKDKADLPNYLRTQLETIKTLKGGKKLVTYAPTYRQTSAVSDASYYQFTDSEVEALKLVLEKHNAILGFRMHYFRNNDNLFNLEKYVDNKTIFDLGHKSFPEISQIIRESDLIISDYSSVFIEALFVNKPVIGFAYDLDSYRDNQDGLLYDMDIAFPGPVVKEFDNLIEMIDGELTTNSQIESDKYKVIRKFYYEYTDAKNSIRVINEVKNSCD